MQFLPTLRVANPVDRDSYMTINAADYRELVHGPLWPEQAADFAGVPPKPVETYTDAERKFAADLMLETVAFRERAVRDRDFGALSPTERMTVLRDYRDEMERGKREYTEHRKGAEEREAAAATEANRKASEQAERLDPKTGKPIVPGQTQGHPVDAVTDEPLNLTDEERAELAKVKLEGGGQADVAAEGQAPETAQPAQPQGGAAPAWAAKKPAETAAPAAPTVEKGPGGKYYVMQGGKPLSPGFPKKADAEAAVPEYTVTT